MKTFHFSFQSRLSRSLRMVVVCAALISRGLAAETPFTRQLTPEEFAAAGLGKLTPAEREKLDALISRRGKDDLSQAREEAARAKAERIAAERKAAEAAARAEALAAAPKPTPPPTASSDASAAKPGWLSKITLKPGTAVEYETVETELVGPFAGWSPGTVFSLANGQRWRVVGSSYVTPKDPAPRKVRIVPGMLGSFFLEIEGVRSRPKVAFVGTTVP
ncbi:MAG: hypothetical protein JNN01_04705 [Opitutaceae bacterium]|nr:hypothetical protein [Opitutaceae bacterium]